MQANLQKLTLFYDGACPLCQAEMMFLSSRNQQGLLDFVDVHSDRYDTKSVGVSCDQALAAMYGQFADGVVIQGVAVFPEAYRRAQLPVFAWLFSRGCMQPILQGAYRFFAKHRHQISKLLGPSALWLVKVTGVKAQL